MTIRPNDVKFEITTPENTASLQAQISYNVPSGEVELYIFGEGETDVKGTKVSGSGSLAFTLQEHDNKVFVAYKPAEHLTIMETKEIFVDRKAPVLTFFEDLGSITTKDAIFRVAGMTESGATVTVNGKPAQINADGSFLIELELVNGANSFEFVSMDPAGNLTRRTVLINRSDVAAAVGSDDVQSFWKTWLPLMIAVVVSLALAVAIVCLFRGNQQLSMVQTLQRWSILTWIVSGVGLGVTIWLLVQKVLSSNVVNTKQFFDKVQASVDEAYEALLTLQFYDQWFLIALIVTLVLALIALGLTLAVLIIRKRGETPPKPPKAPKPKKEAAPTDTPVVTVEPAPAVEPEPVTKPEVAAVSEPAPVVLPPKFCTQCGRKCVEGAAFCAGCGHKLI
jgi:flagellar basal body-associated protein FliL